MKACLKKLNGKDLKPTEILRDPPKTIMGHPAQVSLSLAGKSVAALSSIMYMLCGIMLWTEFSGFLTIPAKARCPLITSI